MPRQTALVICPGRGSYGKAELGSLRHADLAPYDAIRAEAGKPALTDLDRAERFSPSVHLAGANAAPLIYAGSIADFGAIDRDRFDIVAVTGNSMGWYTALAAAGAVEALDGFRIADAMGVNSARHGPGGQLIAGTLGDDWRPVPGRREAMLALAADTGCAISIDLGGTLVLAGEDAALKAFTAACPVETTRLAGNGPFHTPLMADSSAAAFAQLPETLFDNPALPLIDGRGHVWRRWQSAPHALWRYTFGHQVLAAYDFALALKVAIREFAPDRLILLGPGDQLGGAIGQVLVGMGWLGITDKAAFARRQAEDPFLLAMGRPEQRAVITG